MRNSTDFLYSQQLLFMASHAIIDDTLVKSRNHNVPDDDKQLVNMIKQMAMKGCNELIIIQEDRDQHIYVPYKDYEDRIMGMINESKYLSGLVGTRIFIHTMSQYNR